MKNIRPTKFVLAAFALATSSAFAQGVIAFDTAADFTSSFTTTGTYTWNGTGGVGTTGGINPIATELAAFYTTSSAGQFTTTNDTKFVSYFFKAGINTSQNFSGRVAVGFNITTSTGGGLQSGSYVAATINTLANNGTNATSNALGVNYRNGGSGASAADTTFGVLTQNDWYQLRLDLTLTNAATNAYSATVSLYNWGATGTTGGTLVDTYSVGLTASSGGTMSTFTNTNIFAGFIAASSNAGVRALSADNFSATGISAIPEPSSVAALAGLGVLGLAGLRRRRA